MGKWLLIFLNDIIFFVIHRIIKKILGKIMFMLMPASVWFWSQLMNSGHCKESQWTDFFPTKIQNGAPITKLVFLKIIMYATKIVILNKICNYFLPTVISHNGLQIRNTLKMQILLDFKIQFWNWRVLNFCNRNLIHCVTMTKLIRGWFCEWNIYEFRLGKTIVVE